MNKLIEKEYTLHSLEDDDEMFLIKEAISKLTKVQRTIFITYLEEGTLTGTAKKYNVTIPTIKSYLNKIKGIIIDYVAGYYGK